MISLQIKICFVNTIYQYINIFDTNLGLSNKITKNLTSCLVISLLPLFYSNAYFIETVMTLNKRYN